MRWASRGLARSIGAASASDRLLRKASADNSISAPYLHQRPRGFPVMSGVKNHRGWGWIRQRASGRYQASYIGPAHVRHHAPITFEHKIDTEEWLTAERREIQNEHAAVRSAIVNNRSAGLHWVSPAQRQAVVDELLKSQVTLSEYAAEWIKLRPLKPRSTTPDRGKPHSPELGRSRLATCGRPWFAAGTQPRWPTSQPCADTLTNCCARYAPQLSMMSCCHAIPA